MNTDLINKNEISTVLNEIYEIPAEIAEEVVEHFEYLDYPKNYYLLRQGRVCNHVYFITKGIVRYFYIKEHGREMNTGFSYNNQIVTDYLSLIKQAGSHKNIQLLEDSELYAISYDSIQYLIDKHHSFAVFFIKAFNGFYVPKVEDRAYDLQFLDAKQHYKKLLSQFPNIINRVSLGHIASYLNITQETLSRIRACKD